MNYFINLIKRLKDDHEADESVSDSPAEEKEPKESVSSFFIINSYIHIWYTDEYKFFLFSFIPHIFCIDFVECLFELD